MKHILARAHCDVLRRFVSARSRVLVAFDYDGTLAPIVNNPGRAAMRATTRRLLMQVARRYPCAIISGRARADLLRRLKGAGAMAIIGNHGIEPWPTSRLSRLEVRRWQPILAERVARLQGVTIENKVYSVAVHYRRSLDKRHVLRAIEHAAASLGDIRIIPGIEVVNLLARDAPDKGVALERARKRFGCDAAIFVGDDDTDEDVFALDQPGRLLTVRVGRRKNSLASYFLRDQRDIDGFLGALLEAGRAASTTGTRPAR